MKNNKYEVQVYAPTTSDKKEGHIIWEGDEKVEAWAAEWDCTFREDSTSEPL